METGKTNDKTKTLALSGLLCSATLLLTLLNVPLPSGYGFIHLGDAGVFLSVCLLTTPLGAAAAGVGSALADLILGYAMYAPATLIIKGLTALCAMLVLKKEKPTPAAAGRMRLSADPPAVLCIRSDLLHGCRSHRQRARQCLASGGRRCLGPDRRQAGRKSTA